MLQAGVLQKLADAGIRVVLLVPTAKFDYFSTAFSKLRVTVEGVSIPEKRFEPLIMLFAFGLFNIQNRVVRDWKLKKRAMYIAAVCINRTLSKIPALRRVLRLCASRYLVTRALDPLFLKYRPDLVVTTDSFYREDRAISITASRRGIRTVGIIRSWDNATTKGVFLCNPDYITVPTEVLKEELVSIHRVPAERISITGWPHYDSVQNAPYVTREAFCNSLGLDPTRKTILFGPGGEILYQHDKEVLLFLKRLIDTNAFSRPVQFLVRFPPGDVLDASPVEGHPHFIIDKPGTNVTGRKKESEMTPEDNKHLEDSLCHSDVVLTLVSTLAIDGCVFGKPVVILGFDVPGATSQSVSTFAVRMHFKKILESGLLSVPKDERAFIASVNAYLEDPSKDQEMRARLVSRYAYALDGKSAERMAQVILNALQ